MEPGQGQPVQPGPCAGCHPPLPGQPAKSPLGLANAVRGGSPSPGPTLLPRPRPSRLQTQRQAVPLSVSPGCPHPSRQRIRPGLVPAAQEGRQVGAPPRVTAWPATTWPRCSLGSANANTEDTARLSVRGQSGFTGCGQSSGVASVRPPPPPPATRPLQGTADLHLDPPRPALPRQKSPCFLLKKPTQPPRPAARRASLCGRLAASGGWERLGPGACHPLNPASPSSPPPPRLTQRSPPLRPETHLPGKQSQSCSLGERTDPRLVFLVNEAPPMRRRKRGTAYWTAISALVDLT